MARDVDRGQRGVYHIVKRHQSFWRICKSYNVDMDEVARINGIKDKTKIKVGQRIFIPGATRALKVDIYVEDVTAGEKTIAVRYEKGRFIWPVAGGGPLAKGQVTSTFSATATAEKRRHDGIDISAVVGTPVRATDSGKVVYSDNKMRGYGNLIIIEHQDHFFTIYAHNEENLVKEEALIKQGDAIARVGQTGSATGPHLHFEIRKGSTPLDPMRFLP
ncbi:MAG: LysM peptidoglycan-binding domain-containing M23 family metallopeptidase [Desulfobacterales bacterium]|nr:LysM peptidoglycan-binding domain-containing M23 family metallopeptidase [Desulfobacterales bacterium]